MKKYQALPFEEEKYRLAEAPFFDGRTGITSFVDILAGRFFRIFPDGEKKVYDLGQPVGAAVPWKKPGSYILAATDGIYLFENEATKLMFDLRSHLLSWQRCNDAKADPAGRLFFGTSSLDEDLGIGGNLYCLSEDRLRIVESGTGIANGMAWDRMRKRFFFADSMKHAVYVYDYDVDTGEVFGKRELFSIQDGVPDGMCIDPEDNLRVAVWGGFRVEKRSSVTGELLSVIEVPAENVTSACFVNENKLFITSSGEGLSGRDDGKLFCCETQNGL